MKLTNYTREPDETSWVALSYFNYYRFLVAFLFISLYWIGQLPEPLGKYDESLFALSAHVYLAVSIVAIFFIRIKVPRYRLQVAVQILADILLTTIFMYSSAGLNSGFGMLLVIAVAAGGLLSPGRLCILFAAVAALAILGHEVFVHLFLYSPDPNYTHAGFLGMTFFVTAIVTQALSKRVEETEALAKRQAVDLENLSRLNEHIVQRMQSGVIVLDNDLRIKLINGSAQNLLQISGDISNQSITNISPVLGEKVRQWLYGEGDKRIVFKSQGNGFDVQASFIQLSFAKGYDVMLFLDDASLLQQRVQQLKLASLGRLTASIAHEIRNPLGAISHAGQLLSESDAITKSDERLTTIIREHSNRMNNIIENVLSVSRRQKTESDVIDIREWLGKFKEDFMIGKNINSDDVEIEVPQTAVSARIDSSQLHQVLWNLCENSIRYSKHKPLLKLSCNKYKETDRSYIDVVDTGPGISEEVQDQLFEPFFTTNSEGSGLGLYLARELCEANQATLSLHGNTKEGCCFRITFSHLEKQHILN